MAERMDIPQAMHLLGIKGIENANEQTIKKNYKSIIKTVHPDLGGDTAVAKKIIEAYEVMLEAAARLEEFNKNRENIEDKDVITVYTDELIRVYKGETIKVQKIDGEYRDINRGDIPSIKILIGFLIRIKSNGEESIFNRFLMRNQQDLYEIDINLGEIGVNLLDEIELTVMDKKRNIKLTSKNILVPIVFDYNIRANIKITL